MPAEQRALTSGTLLIGVIYYSAHGEGRTWHTRHPEGDLEKDVSVSVTPNRLAQAVVQGGAARRAD